MTSDLPSEENDFYKVLGINRDSDSAAIKKAYYRLALKYHPDRQNSLDNLRATRHFQLIGRAYEVLIDDSSRKYYDAFGEAPDDTKTPASWDQYFRELFSRVTMADLAAFEASYCGSAEEVEDILSAYKKYHGDLSKISDVIYFGSPEQEHRYAQVIETAIRRRIVPSFASFEESLSNEVARERRRKESRKEAGEAEALRKELGLDKASSAELGSIIRSRSQRRMEQTIASLEEKYKPKPKPKATTTSTKKAVPIKHVSKKSSESSPKCTARAATRKKRT